VLSGLRDRLAQAPSLKSKIFVGVTPPPTIDPAAREMADSMAGPLYIGCYSVWDDDADDEANERWQHATLKSPEPITHGQYMGETDLLSWPTRAAESLGPGVWQRLEAIR
jgi:hypothetical protein